MINEKSIQSLLIFIKNPILGKVKTRLAHSLGDKEALNIYYKLLKHTKQTCQGLPFHKVVCYSHFIDDNDDWNKDIFNSYLQQGTNLGERMENAFSKRFEQGSKQTVIIGSDCPEITPNIIQRAFFALDSLHDVVIGPSLDGGYYLLGTRKHYPELFHNIEWSSSHVFETTLQKIRQLELSVQILPPLSDIDYLEDWEKYKW